MNTLNELAQAVKSFASDHDLTIDNAIKAIHRELRDVDRYNSDGREMSQPAHSVMRKIYNRNFLTLAKAPRSIVAAHGGVGPGAMADLDAALAELGLQWATSLPYTANDPIEACTLFSYTLEQYKKAGIVTVGDLVKHPKYGKHKYVIAIKKLL